ncbi:MAG: hemerythrin domain-containing protein [Ideonella sp.]
MSESSSSSPALGRAAIRARSEVLKFIKHDHRSFKETVHRFAKLDLHSDRQAADAMVRTFIDNLRFHSQFEQAHLYPAVQASCTDRHITELAQVEHDSIEVLLDSLQTRRAGDDHFSALFQAVGEQLLRHVKREEAEIFPLLKQAPLDWPAMASLLLQRDLSVAPTMRAVLQAVPGDRLNPPDQPTVDDHIEPPTVLAIPDTPAERRAAVHRAPIK